MSRGTERGRRFRWRRFSGRSAKGIPFRSGVRYAGRDRNILSRVSVTDGISVEEIQNQVEVALMAERYYTVAKAYMLYRQRHTEDREVRDKLQFLMEYCDASNAATGSSSTPMPTWRTRTWLRSSSLAQIESHPPEPPHAHRPPQGDVRQGVMDKYIEMLNDGFHLQKRRNFAGQLLRFDYDVSLAHRRNDFDRGQFSPDQPQVILRRLREYGFYQIGMLSGIPPHPNF